MHATFSQIFILQLYRYLVNTIHANEVRASSVGEIESIQCFYFFRKFEVIKVIRNVFRSKTKRQLIVDAFNYSAQHLIVNLYIFNIVNKVILSNRK